MINKVVNYLRESRDELKKVTWPKRDEVIRLTLVVLVVSAVTAVYLGLLDAFFSNLVSLAVRLRQ